jgi:hypothetical protein
MLITELTIIESVPMKVWFLILAIGTLAGKPKI